MAVVDLRVLPDSSLLTFSSLELATLLALARSVQRGVRTVEVLEEVFVSFDQLLPYDRLGLAVIDTKSGLVCSKWAKSKAPRMELDNTFCAPLVGSSLEEIIVTGRPRIINDLQEHYQRSSNSDATRLILKEGVRSSLTCPLRVNDKAVGFLFFSSFQANTYREVHGILFNEVSEAVAASLEKSRVCEELQALNEMKNRFLGIAAHDLRNPIVASRHYLEMLDDGFLGPVEGTQLEVIQRLHRISNSMLSLVNDLLDISVIESGQIRLRLDRIQPEALLKEAYAINQVIARARSITLSLELPNAPLAPVRGDSERLMQVVCNLISNAFKYAANSQEIRLGVTPTGHGTRFWVTDQGPGIVREEQAVIFEDFGRASSPAAKGEKSTGLGLSICRRIVEAHGGKLWVESEVGHGATFHFTIPTIEN